MNEASVEDQLRFGRKVKRSAGCWIWTGASGKWGRVAWFFTNGPIPQGMHVLHRCDNTHCVRPDHLFLGTHQDNMQDCKAKGREPMGERNGNAVLTEDLVRLIRASPKKTKALGAELGINFETIYKVRQGKSWGWLT